MFLKTAQVTSCSKIKENVILRKVVFFHSFVYMLGKVAQVADRSKIRGEMDRTREVESEDRNICIILVNMQNETLLFLSVLLPLMMLMYR